MPSLSTTLFVIYMFGPGGMMPVPNSPGFISQTECEQALVRVDAFLPGKTACWPAPFMITAEPTPGPNSQRRSPPHQGAPWENHNQQEKID